MVRVFYSPQYVGSAYVFDTTRKAKWVAASLTSRPHSRGRTGVAAIALCTSSLLQVHAPAYVEAVRTGCPEALPSRRASTGTPGCGRWCSRQTAAPSPPRSPPSGLVWPARSRAACTMHGASTAPATAPSTAWRLRHERPWPPGPRSVLILDLDAHCGGGTASLIAEEPRIWQLDVSVCDFDCYESCERATLRMVREAAEYWVRSSAVCMMFGGGAITSTSACTTPGWTRSRVATPAGCPALRVRFCRAREQLVFDWCRERELPIAFVLAGGYAGDLSIRKGLVDLHRLTLSAATAGPHQVSSSSA